MPPSTNSTRAVYTNTNLREGDNVLSIEILMAVNGPNASKTKIHSPNLLPQAGRTYMKRGYAGLQFLCIEEKKRL